MSTTSELPSEPPSEQPDAEHPTPPDGLVELYEILEFERLTEDETRA